MPRTADWFSNLSKKAQAEYLKAHPNSKYGKAKAPAVKARGTITAANIAKIKDKKPNPAGAMMVKLADIELKHFRQKDPVKKAALKTQMVALKAKIKKVLAESKTVSKVAAKGAAHEVKRAADKNKVVAKTPSAKVKAKDNLAKLMETLKLAKARLAKQRRENKVSRSLPTQVLQLEAKVKAAKAKKPTKNLKAINLKQSLTRKDNVRKARTGK